MTTGTNKPEPVGLTAAQKQHYFRLWIIAGLSLPVICEFRYGYVSFFFGLIKFAAMRGVAVPFIMLHVLMFAIFSLMSIWFFLWTFRGRYKATVPKRTIGLWFLVCASYPWQVYDFFRNIVPKFYSEEQQYLADNPVVYLFEFADVAVLICLGVWLTRRRLRFSVGEKLWFHWLLFVTICLNLRFFERYPLGY